MEEIREKIEKALEFFGIEAEAKDCDVCSDGSVYWNLVMILPKGTLGESEQGVWFAWWDYQ